ncbi:MAG: 30S ribosomal protein S8 [Candidatus Micrarchaeota archaeon]
MVDTLANALNTIKVAELKGKQEVRVRPASKMVREVLSAMQRDGYIGEFELIDDGKSGEFSIKLLGKINNCGVVNPHYSVKKKEWEKLEQKFLPGREVGTIIASTPQGVMSHNQAKQAGVGGRVVAFVY